MVHKNKTLNLSPASKHSYAVDSRARLPRSKRYTVLNHYLNSQLRLSRNGWFGVSRDNIEMAARAPRSITRSAAPATTADALDSLLLRPKPRLRYTADTRRVEVVFLRLDAAETAEFLVALFFPMFSHPCQVPSVQCDERGGVSHHFAMRFASPYPFFSSQL